MSSAVTREAKVGVSTEQRLISVDVEFCAERIWVQEGPFWRLRHCRGVWINVYHHNVERRLKYWGGLEENGWWKCVRVSWATCLLSAGTGRPVSIDSTIVSTGGIVSTATIVSTGGIVSTATIVST
jgi:hypothetical protein